MSGPERFDRFVERAVAGFFGAGRGAGRHGSDFLTSPEVGPLFGLVIARWVASVRERLGDPPGFTVLEVGAGRGALARSVRRTLPDVRYVAVEPSAVLRDRLPDTVEAAAEMPDTIGPGVVIANELLDNLPFRLVGQAGEAFVEGGRLVARPYDGARPAPALDWVPRQDAAAGWVRRARAALDGGSVLALDYAATTAELGRRPWRDWVRTFREHGPGTDPLEDPGSQDVTVVVCVDQLPPPDRDRSQAEFLRAHGLEDLVEEGRRTWEERAHLGDLVALEGRSRVREAEALTDPAGLGALRALEWDA